MDPENISLLHSICLFYSTLLVLYTILIKWPFELSLLLSLLRMTSTRQMAPGTGDPWELDLSTSVAILFGIFGFGMGLLNLYLTWEQLDHVRV